MILEAEIMICGTGIMIFAPQFMSIDPPIMNFGRFMSFGPAFMSFAAFLSRSLPRRRGVVRPITLGYAAPISIRAKPVSAAPLFLT